MVPLHRCFQNLCSIFRIQFLVLPFVSFEQGSDPGKGGCPVEWEEIPSVLSGFLRDVCKYRFTKFIPVLQDFVLYWAEKIGMLFLLLIKQGRNLQNLQFLRSWT